MESSFDGLAVWLERLPESVAVALLIVGVWFVRQLLSGSLMTRRHHEELMAAWKAARAAEIEEHAREIDAYQTRGAAMATEIERQRQFSERVIDQARRSDIGRSNDS